MSIKDRLYQHSPVWIQNAGISLYGLAHRRELFGGAFEQYVAEFRERDRWAPERMRSFVEKRMRELLVHAFEQVPYYQRKWSALGISSSDLNRIELNDLSRLPLTPKADLRANPDQFLAQDIAKAEKILTYYTSGSTGTPIACYYTASGHRQFMAAREVRSFGWAGTSIRRPRSTIGGRMVVPKAEADPPFYRYNLAERHVYFSAYHISSDHVRDYVRGFNRYRPRVLTGYAYSHYALSRLMLEHGLQLEYKPDALVLSSEKLTAAMKETILQAFQARAYEEYGTVEQCVLATECEHGNLHVNLDFAFLEIIDDEGRPAPPGQAGRLVCTGLLNDAQPLVRYDIGDIGLWSASMCPCERSHLPVLQEVVGRLEDAIVCADGRELVRFHGLFVNVPHVLEAQVVQEPDRLIIKVVPLEGFTEAEEKLIYDRTIQRTGPMRVEIERVPAIERTERGKFRSVVSARSRTRP